MKLTRKIRGRRNSRRKLGVQALEQRRLLAGDLLQELLAFGGGQSDMPETEGSNAGYFSFQNFQASQAGSGNHAAQEAFNFSAFPANAAKITGVSDVDQLKSLAPSGGSNSADMSSGAPADLMSRFDVSEVNSFVIDGANFSVEIDTDAVPTHADFLPENFTAVEVDSGSAAANDLSDVGQLKSLAQSVGRSSADMSSGALSDLMSRFDVSEVNSFVVDGVNFSVELDTDAAPTHADFLPENFTAVEVDSGSAAANDLSDVGQLKAIAQRAGISSDANSDLMSRFDVSDVGNVEIDGVEFTVEVDTDAVPTHASFSPDNFTAREIDSAGADNGVSDVGQLKALGHSVGRSSADMSSGALSDLMSRFDVSQVSSVAIDGGNFSVEIDTDAASTHSEFSPENFTATEVDDGTVGSDAPTFSTEEIDTALDGGSVDLLAPFLVSPNLVPFGPSVYAVPASPEDVADSLAREEIDFVVTNESGTQVTTVGSDSGDSHASAVDSLLSLQGEDGLGETSIGDVVLLNDLLTGLNQD